ncbi:unnamed protein product [Rhizophagus irregularis]|nr:unnamed protein product [Rhizophagus irregularis]
MLELIIPNEDASLNTKPDFEVKNWEGRIGGRGLEPRFISDGLPIFGKGETKIHKYVQVGFRVPKNGRPKICNGKFGELPMNGNQDSFGGLLTNGEPRFVRCLRRMEKPKDLGSGGFLKIGKRRTKVHKFWVGLQSSDKVEPRFMSTNLGLR